MKQFPPILHSSGQWVMQFSDFSSYPSTYAWKQCKLYCSRSGPKPDSDQFPLQKLWASKERSTKCTRSHSHRKILCYLEVTSTRFRELSCLRSTVAPCNIQSSAVTRPHSSINAIGKLILCANAGKCSAGVLSKHQHTALEIIKQEVLHHTRIFFKWSFKINSLIKTCGSVFLMEFWGYKMVFILPSYPQASPASTPLNDFPSRTDAASVLRVLISSCLHLGSINTQPFEGNRIGWFNYCNPITFISFPHSNVSVMEVIRKILIRLKHRPAMQ